MLISGQEWWSGVAQASEPGSWGRRWCFRACRRDLCANDSVMDWVFRRTLQGTDRRRIPFPSNGAPVVHNLETLRMVLEQALPPGSQSRRDFMALSGTALGGAWLMGVLAGCEAASSDAVDAAAVNDDFSTFTEREALDFEAFSALMIPTDEQPGAREAGTVYFADNVLGSHFGFMLSTIQSGLADLSARATAVDAAAAGLADLDQDNQLAIVRAVETENPGFFGAARFLVMLGFTAHPSYGGNRNKVGWQVLGFEDEFSYQPPFGAYDRPIHEGGAS